MMMHPKLPLVLIEGLSYARKVGKETTNIVKAEEPLLAEHVELFRKNPEAFLGQAEIK
jgi:hypothetical protein